MTSHVDAALLSPSAWEAVVAQTRTTFLALYAQVVARVPAAVIALVVLVLTSWGARLAQRSTDAVGTRVLRSLSLRILFRKSSAIIVWMAGVLIACLLVFPGLRLGDLVATLGLGSVAIGFAFQDIFKNFLAGILLLANEPFRIGDAVVIDKYEGVIETVDIRTTNLRTYGGELVLIPNSIVFTNSVQVRTEFVRRRTDLTVGVDYATDLPDALELTRTTIANLEGVLDEPAVVVDATGFGESSIDLVVRYWTTSDGTSVLRTKTRAILAIKAVYDRAGIGIPFPIRTLEWRG
jgi:small-conductance mechanosensitive channel